MRALSSWEIDDIELHNDQQLIGPRVKPVLYSIDSLKANLGPELQTINFLVWRENFEG